MIMGGGFRRVDLLIQGPKLEKVEGGINLHFFRGTGRSRHFFKRDLVRG